MTATWTVHDIEQSNTGADVYDEYERTADAWVLGFRIAVTEEAWVDEPRDDPQGRTYYSTWCRVVTTLFDDCENEVATDYTESIPCGMLVAYDEADAVAQVTRWLAGEHVTELADVSPAEWARTLIGGRDE